MSSQNQKVFFPNLDGLRFFAFFAVFLQHSFSTKKAELLNTDVYHWATFVSKKGFLGVNFFFVLSGFLITYLLFKEREITGRIHLKNFYIRRALRIWPLYYAMLAWGFLVYPLLKIYLVGKAPNELANPWMYMAFLGNFDYAYNAPPESPNLGVLWSLAIEEQFYVVWPLFLALVPKRATLIALGVAFGLLFINRFIFADGYIYHPMLSMNTVGAIIDMVIGGIAAYFCYYSKGFTDAIAKMPKWSIILTYIAGFASIMVYDELKTVNWFIILHRPVYAAFFAFIIIEQCYAEHSVVKMSRFKLLSKWGLVTYGLYCMHMILINSVQLICAKFGLDTQLWHVMVLIPAISFVLTIITGLLVYRFYEAPFLKLKDRFAYITK